MLAIPIAGVYALLAATHLGSSAGLLVFALQNVINYNPYVQVYFS